MYSMGSCCVCVCVFCVAVPVCENTWQSRPTLLIHNVHTHSAFSNRYEKPLLHFVLTCMVAATTCGFDNSIGVRVFACGAAAAVTYTFRIEGTTPYAVKSGYWYYLRYQTCGEYAVAHNFADADGYLWDTNRFDWVQFELHCEMFGERCFRRLGYGKYPSLDKIYQWICASGILWGRISGNCEGF